MFDLMIVPEAIGAMAEFITLVNAIMHVFCKPPMMKDTCTLSTL